MSEKQHSVHATRSAMWQAEIQKFHMFGVLAPAAYYRYRDSEKEAAQQALQRSRSSDPAAA